MLWSKCQLGSCNTRSKAHNDLNDERREFRAPAKEESQDTGAKPSFASQIVRRVEDCEGQARSARCSLPVKPRMRTGITVVVVEILALKRKRISSCEAAKGGCKNEPYVELLQHLEDDSSDNTLPHGRREALEPSSLSSRVLRLQSLGEFSHDVVDESRVGRGGVELSLWRQRGLLESRGALACAMAARASGMRSL